MTDDLLSLLGRKQRDDLDEPLDGASEQDPLTRPFDDDERAAILDALFERVEEQTSEGAAERDESATRNQPVARAEPAPSNVVSLASRSRRVLVGSVLALAAAAAVVVWFVPRSEPNTVAMVPDYAFTKLGGGVAVQRSDDNPLAAELPELTLRLDSTIDWVLTPAQPTQAPVGVALLARSDAGARVFVPRLAAERSAQGAVRVRGRIGELVELELGSWTLELLVAAPEQLPTNADAAAETEAPWRRLSLRVIIVADE